MHAIRRTVAGPLCVMLIVVPYVEDMVGAQRDSTGGARIGDDWALTYAKDEQVSIEPAASSGGLEITEARLLVGGGDSRPPQCRGRHTPKYRSNSLADGDGGALNVDMGRRHVQGVIDAGGETFYRYEFDCRGAYDRAPEWFAESDLVASPSGNDGVPMVDPAVLAQQLYNEVVTTFPTPTLHVAPADVNASGHVYVQYPAFWWVDEWEPLNAFVSAGPVEVSMTAAPARVQIDPGVPGEVFACDAAPPFVSGADPATFDGCGYLYEHSSSVAPNGSTWDATATMVWHVTWTSNVGAGGDLGNVATTSPPRPLAVAERQVLVGRG